MTTIADTGLLVGPKNAHQSVSFSGRHHRSSFSEVRAARRQRTLAIVAISTGILSVSVAASAAVVIGLGA
ncbi:hypothetical protein JOE58_003315 [Curtobacterium luteum]|uniref:Uncharacterized protein n=1 Tax=Curtobacterium luteum TaxID=33881 RepID=A0ABS2S1S2_9MICO|nr:hypothetical protein [Curtobacterium luteum]MBM7804064.1 hypothetical protein [Curtobacterium luteum]NUU49841.1 hypothetical protein [Curtobacterium luteum]